MTTWAERNAQFKAANPPAADNVPKKEPPDYVWNEAKRGLLGELIGGIADTPGRIVNLAIAAYGMSEIPSILGLITGKPAINYRPDLIESLRDPATRFLLKQGGVENLKPENGAEKVLGAMAMGATGSLASGGPGVSLAKTGVNALKVAAMGGTAGGAADLGGEAAVSSEFLTDMLGEAGARTLGGLAGGVGVGTTAATVGGVPGVVTRMYQEGKNAAANPANAAQANAIANKVVDRTIKYSAAGSPASETIANLEEAARLRARFPGFNPSVAESANAPGMLDIQRKYATLNPQNLNEEAARVAGSKQALLDAFNQTAPNNSKPGAIRSAVNESIAADTKALAASGQEVAQQLPRPDLVKLGSKASDIAAAEKSAAKAMFGKLYDDAFAIDKSVSIPSSDILKSIEDSLGMPLAQVRPETLPNTFKAIQRFIGGQDGAGMQAEMNALANPVAKKTALTLQEAVDLRRAISADASMASRSTDPLAATRLRNIGKVRAVIDDSIEASPIAREAKDALANADARYGTEYVPRFKEGANQRMFKDTSANEPRILPDRFVDEYFKPDQASGSTRASQFNQLFGASAEAKSLAKTGIMDKYRNAVVDPVSGQIDIAKHSKFVQEHDRTLTQFKANGVDALSDIKTLGVQAAKVYESQKALDRLTSKLKFDTTDELLDAALKDRKVMGNVQMRMGQDVREMFNGRLMSKAWETGTGKGMAKFLDDHRDTLKMTLSKEHLSTLDDLSKGLSIVERSPVKGAISGSGTDPLKSAAGVSMATVWSQWRAVTGGRQGAATMGFNLAAPVMTRLGQTQFDDVMKTALHDPASATALKNFLSSTSQQQATGWFNKLMAGVKTAGGIALDMNRFFTAYTVSRAVVG